MSTSGWIGVDLDGTLAEYHGWGNGEIGDPVPAMLERVKKWLAELGYSQRGLMAYILQIIAFGTKRHPYSCPTKKHISMTLEIGARSI